MIHAYCAHPLGPEPGRLDNAALAKTWFLWMAEQRVVPVASWIIIASVWPEARKEEGFAIDFEQISRCDELWLCGPRVSPGMLEEAKFAKKKKNIHVVDFTWLGLVTPTGKLTSFDGREWTHPQFEDDTSHKESL